MVNEDFPEPETPVTTTSLLRGIETETFFKLCNLAPLITMLLLKEVVVAIIFSADFFSLSISYKCTMHVAFRKVHS